jgi:hypothetical protein
MTGEFIVRELLHALSKDNQLGVVAAILESGRDVNKQCLAGAINRADELVKEIVGMVERALSRKASDAGHRGPRKKC